jgi:hypothetical protein
VKRAAFSFQLSVFSFQLSAFCPNSDQPSPVSLQLEHAPISWRSPRFQLSAVSFLPEQRSAIARQPSARTHADFPEEPWISAGMFVLLMADC